jgi:hypothetical protein
VNDPIRVRADAQVVARVRRLDGNPYTSVHADDTAQPADLRTFKIEMTWVLR